jgi:hypothetical protein
LPHVSCSFARPIFFIRATQIQTQTNNGYFTKIRNGGTFEFAIFKKIRSFNINTKFVRFFNIIVEVKQIKTILFLLSLKKVGIRRIPEYPQKKEPCGYLFPCLMFYRFTNRSVAYGCSDLKLGARSCLLTS